MKRLNQWSESDFLRLLFGFLTLSMFAMALILPDRSHIFAGFRHILGSTMKTPTNAFVTGGYAGTFFSGGLVCLACTLLFHLPGAQANTGSLMGFLLTMGFTLWEVNIFNMWFGVLGVLLYSLVKREAPGKQVNSMLFSTALTPLYSDLLLRYPLSESQGFRWYGLLLALVVGLLVGFLLPAGLLHSPKTHKGYSIYSAALPIGLCAFFLRALLYTLAGVPVPEGPAAQTLLVSSIKVSDGYCILLFLCCIVVSLLMGCRPKHYWQLMKDSGYQVDFIERYGNATFLMNVGCFGLFILLYFHFIGARFNGVTLGCVFAMLATCGAGSHPRNVFPIMLGYVLIASAMRTLFGADYALAINAQSIVIGLSFANALSPISGRYGWYFGMLASMLHYCIVTCVPELHGGFLLYNGGFTACLVCIFLIPILEHFFKTKEERAQAALADTQE